jgi:uncharacterized membrane-anchored protein YhcB (DUF1043 family)
MVDIIGFFFLGIIVFVVGLSIGWNMRGSVKEEELQRYRSLHDKIDKNQWALDDLKKKVK